MRFVRQLPPDRSGQVREYLPKFSLTTEKRRKPSCRFLFEIKRSNPGSSIRSWNANTQSGFTDYYPVLYLEIGLPKTIIRVRACRRIEK